MKCVKKPVMKLLTIISFYPPHTVGGYEIRCKEVMDRLSARGHEVMIITSRCPNATCGIHTSEDRIYRVLHQKKEARTILTQILHDCIDINFIMKKTKKFDPDIIYIWHIDSLSNSIFPYYSYQKKQLVLDDGSSEARFLNRLLRSGLYFFKNEKDPVWKRWLKTGGHLLANLVSFNLIRPWWSWPQNLRIYFGSSASLRFADEDGAPVNDAQVFHSGIDISQFPYVPRHGLGSPIRILVPGRVHPQKGTRDALLLAYELAKDGYPVKLLLVGARQSPQYSDEIVCETKTLGLNHVVTYQSMVTRTELARLYQEYDICFFPSYLRPGLSRVPLEAMASGCLVISYGNEGSSEIIRDHETGFLVTEGDVTSAAVLIEGMVKSPAEYKKITQRAREQIEQEHTMDAYIDKIEAYLRESLLNRSRVPS